MSYWIGVLIVAPFWGMLSMQFLVQAVLGFTGFLFTLIGVLKRAIGLNQLFMAFVGSLLAGGVVFAILFIAGFWICGLLGFGNTVSETVVYCAFAVFSLWFMAEQFILKIRKQWRNGTIPGSLEADIFTRKFG